MKANLRPLQPAFTFAGFSFPKYVWTLPKYSGMAPYLARQALALRLKTYKEHQPSLTGPYYHEPQPNNNNGVGFYLKSDGMPGLRWTWADKVAGARINHTGWYTDDDGSREKIRGIVFRLPRGRGFLAGWSMGAGMASGVESFIYDDERDAAYAADSVAENVADDERSYQEDNEPDDLDSSDEL